ncbi:MAG: hypothetical protein ACQKBT_03820 [Puniceicoccales bacterium]
MSFILLLLLSIHSVVLVETKTATQFSETNSARMNALTGLYIALGEIQKHTGPDQRVTANATLLDSDIDNTELDGIYPSRSQWTGVWSDSDTLETWLVSGNHRKDAEISPLTSDSSAATMIQILEEHSVEAPLESIDSSSSFAYWVSDEGMKAKVNLASINAEHPLTSASKVEVSQMTEMDWLTTESASLGNAIHPSALELLSATSAENSAIDSHYHNITTYSHGLLINPVDGGFKEDLTLAFFDSDQLPTGQIFPPMSGTPSDLDPGGPLWEQLTSWVTTSANSQDELPVREQTDSQSGYFPIITQYQFYVLPRYDSSSANQRIYLDVIPAVTLWNPYDRKLEETDYVITFGRSYIAAGGEPAGFGESLFYKWYLSWDRDGDGSISYNNWPDPNSDSTDETENLFSPESLEEASLSFTISNLSLEPGESITYSAPSGSRPIDLFAVSQIATTGQNELTPGFRQNASYYIDTGHDLSLSATAPSNPSFKLGPWSPASSFSAQLAKIKSNGEPEYLQQVSYLSGWQSGTAKIGDSMQTLSTIPNLADLNGSLGFKAVRNFTNYYDNGTVPGDESVQWIAQNNPRGSYQSALPIYFYDLGSASNIRPIAYLNPSFYSTYYAHGDEITIGLPQIGNEAGVGYEAGAGLLSNSPQRAVLYESAPTREGLHSIGQLTHAPLYYFNESSAGLAPEDIGDYRLKWTRADNLLPAYSIGNSKADSAIALDEIYTQWDNSRISGYFTQRGTHYDYSYLLNDSLWDQYFFSTLPDNSSRLPENTRLLAIDPDSFSALDRKTLASEFMIDGAFNINSTSEEAWRAILSAFYGQSLDSQQPVGSPYLRVQNEPGKPFLTDTDTDETDSAYSGYRTLTSDQINALSRQIVKEIQRRGPFASLADFINRMPGKDAPSSTPNGGQDAFRLRGAIDAAILASDQLSNDEASDLGVDPNEAAINIALYQSPTAPRSETEISSSAQDGWRAENIPGWLTQADVLARLGSVITNRSDTFKVVFYGQSISPITNEVVASALGEAVVQRMPDYNDTTNIATESIANLSPRNQVFGRGYKVTHFQWLED